MKDNRIADKWRNEGNSLYKQRKFEDAVIAYNKSLCFAETGSKQLALAYGNRSAVYLEVGLYDDCLANIQLARDKNHPDLTKLRDREEKCLAAQKKFGKKLSEKYRTDLFKLSYEPNKKYPSIVDCLELRENETFGRYIITNRDLLPGDIIAIEEPAFKSMETVEPRYRRCNSCLQSNNHNLIPCDGLCTISEFNLIVEDIFKLSFAFYSNVLPKLRE
jgi:SET and MYND domain-containing protein 4